MDAQLSWVDEGDKEFHLEIEEEEMASVQDKEQKKDTTQPDQKVLQNRIQIQGNDPSFWAIWAALLLYSKTR